MSAKVPARTEHLDRPWAKIAAGQTSAGAAADAGISARLAERGSDPVVFDDPGRFRMAGRASLAGLMPDGDANANMPEPASEVQAGGDRTPVLAGVSSAGLCRQMGCSRRVSRDTGFARVQVFPQRLPVRRDVPPAPRGDGHGLRAGGQDGSPRPRPGPADDPIRDDDRRCAQ